MKLNVTYTNGKSETYVGVETLDLVKKMNGDTEKLVVSSFSRVSALYPKRETEANGIEKMELFF